MFFLGGQKKLNVNGKRITENTICNMKEIDKKKRSTAISEIETKVKELFPENEEDTEKHAMAQLKTLEKPP